MGANMIDEAFVKRHSAAVPRYTSYPPAQVFSGKVQAPDYFAWLAALPAKSRLSIYVHIPFCHALCWYCGCNTRVVNRQQPVMSYLSVVEQELANVAALLPAGHEVCHIHFGGGSPNILSAASIRQLDKMLRSKVRIAEGAEIAVEIDPRNLSREQVDAFATAGVTRASIGVQDFDPKVQQAINREQGFDVTRGAVELLREAGVESLNIDLVYGLPHQTRATLTRTIEQALSLRPDRIAVFGYAHLPARFRHQALIDDAALPGPVERFAQSRRVSRLLLRAGYQQIGLDHFALPADALAVKPLRRNFQGYTTDAADALIGIGASAIGRLPRGYVQNAVSVVDYKECIEKSGLATVRGVALTEDDRMRAFAIERIMCDFEFPAVELRRRFGAAADRIIEEAEAIVATDRDRLVKPVSQGGFVVTSQGHPFVREICAYLDAYIGPERGQHALAV